MNAQLKKYLDHEARRYFPWAKNIDVEFKNESTFIGVDGTKYECEAGSDDDWFVFNPVRAGMSFTIPLMPE